MGTYINPGNSGFARILAGEYVDKTGLIGEFSKTLCSARNLVCITRPRRFGKSFAAESLVAYYSCGCDSRELFAGLEASRSEDFAEHLNAYNVVRLDMSSFTRTNMETVVPAVTNRLREGLRQEFPGVELHDALDLALLDAVRASGRKFIFVIDEWDAPLREGRTAEAKEEWIYFLRLLFKNASLTGEAVAGAYMTGILPIRRYGTQSALSDFREYTMLNPVGYAPYVGFTEAEVEQLAAAHDMDMEALRRWYDGYELPGIDHVYAPYSAMEACVRRQIGPYWTTSETFESLRTFIDLDFDGLQQAIVQALGGAAVPVRVGSFVNDMHETTSRDDVLTLLIHLGYLCYDAEARTAHVPNEEIRDELRDAVGRSRHANVARIVKESDALLQATWEMDAPGVAQAIQDVHNGYSSPLFYNGEQSLRAVVKAAYISASDHYAVIEELPGGQGFADIAFVPKRGSMAPAMLVELKWNRAPEAAIAQMRGRDYPAAFRGWDGPILLVGITYDPKTKEHACTIEEA